MRRTISTAPWAPTVRANVRLGVDKTLRRMLLSRCAGRCELCGERLPTGGWHPHHRKLKGQGGVDEITNLLALDALCHRRVHGHVAWAHAHGFLVTAYTATPALLPVAIGLTRWSLLSPDGSYTDTDPPETSEEST